MNVTNPALGQVVATQFRRNPGRRPEAMRAEPDDTLLAAWQKVEPKLRRLLAAMGTARSQIDDVLQDVYLAAHQSAPPDDEDGCRRWLFRVAINRCRLEHRRRRRWLVVWEKLHQAWTEYSRCDETDQAAGREECAAVRRALARLPPELRNPIVLRYYCDLNSTDIGQILDVPAATVRGQLSAARQRMADALREAGFKPNEE
jgi:RNA polymerase sigma factor (sigma-70 family)